MLSSNSFMQIWPWILPWTTLILGCPFCHIALTIYLNTHIPGFDMKIYERSRWCYIKKKTTLDARHRWIIIFFFYLLVWHLYNHITFRYSDIWMVFYFVQQHAQSCSIYYMTFKLHIFGFFTSLAFKYWAHRKCMFHTESSVCSNNSDN